MISKDNIWKTHKDLKEAAKAFTNQKTKKILTTQLLEVWQEILRKILFRDETSFKIFYGDEKFN